ncbi:helix-turn-helix domain-containing protein [Microbacterium sp. MPKO10]|uniref:winged helix-turn-helix transcriptional regulator n=1 Tax=Microbacterium sp. MPKO10 TaxID=2989818 RepID=UPI0022354E14|nr:helix-turn-helix domain-containing protein [Microbacterium sp. MPKO10]MCW4458847.1 helix-turn-helix transcriptional regulator [Microbacterium sp. MPKO10]
MASRRSYSSYNDGCAAAHALDLIGERWTLIVVRELLLGPKRFADLQRDVLGISPTVLSQRLRDLESRGIVERHTLPAPARVDVYELTEWGSRLEAVNAALSLWAVASPDLPWDADMSPDTLVLAMRAHARGDVELTQPARINLRLTDSRLPNAEPVSYVASVTPELTTIEKAPSPGPVDAEVVATTASWKACILGGVSLDDQADATATGSDAAIEALIRATRLEAAPEAPSSRSMVGNG